MVLTLVSVLSLSVVGVSAQVASTDLTALAAEFPEDAVFFASIRTDDAFIDELDALLAPFYPYAEDLPPGFTLRDGLDLALIESELGLDFERSVRPWLGNTAAAAAFVDPNTLADTEFLTTDRVFDNLEAIIAVEITDRAAAETFFNNAIEAQDADIEATQRGAYTYYEIPFGPVIAIDDDTLLFGEEFIMVETGVLAGDFASLSSSGDLSNTLALLPQSDYNAALYVNVPEIQSVIQTVADTSTDLFGASDAEESLAALNVLELGSGVVGFTVLDGRTLTVDLALQNGAALIQEAQIGSVDPNFAAQIPAATPLVLHGTNLNGILQGALDTISELGTETDAQELEEGITELNDTLQAEVGLTLEDIIGWMVNDYALLLRPSDSALNATSIFGLLGDNPLDGGILIDASADPAAAVRLVDVIEKIITGELADTITQEEEDVTIDLAREGDILTVTVTSGELPFPVEVQVGVSNDVFFIGTPGIASSILAGDGGLGSTSNFEGALSLTLPDTYSLYYADFDNLAPVVEILESVAEDEDAADIALLGELLALFDHATLSQSLDTDGNAFTRATITLAGE